MQRWKQIRQAIRNVGWHKWQPIRDLRWRKSSSINGNDHLSFPAQLYSGGFAGCCWWSSPSSWPGCILRMAAGLCLLLLLFYMSQKDGLTWALQSESILPAGDMDHRAVLDRRGSYVMLWDVKEDIIIFEVQVATQGYVGLGFSYNGGMKGADIVIGWIDDSGQIHFKDYHGLGNRTPTEDVIQDYQLLGGYKNDTHVVLRFSRSWITCDEQNDFQIKEDTVRVLWAYHSENPDPSKTTMSRHEHRGVSSLYLKEPRQRPAPDLDDPSIMPLDLRSPNVTIPSDTDTLYWCSLHRIPPMDKKRQMIGYVPLISESSLPHVHHMVLYQCHLDQSTFHLEKWLDQGGVQCYGENMPLSWLACNAPLIAWAIGSKGDIYPEHLGFPLGENHDGADYFLLEVHYNNPELVQGVVDNSGLRLYVTDELRRFDAGVLIVGHQVSPTMIIPPGRDWKTIGHCTSSCTQKALPPEGIRGFGALLHAHLLGRSITMQLIRKDRELEPVTQDLSYDFNYQQNRVFPSEVAVYPGDHLIVTCGYNTSHLTHPTFGGFNTVDEMCIVFLQYYPKIPFSTCYSRPDISLLFETFKIENVHNLDYVMQTFNEGQFDENIITKEREDQSLVKMKKKENKYQKYQMIDFMRSINISEPASLSGKSFYEILNDKATWEDPAIVDNLREVVTQLNYQPSCIGAGRRLIKGVPKKAKVPRFHKYIPEEVTCVSSDVIDANDVPVDVQEPGQEVDLAGTGVQYEG